jgi:hypothetical protein
MPRNNRFLSPALGKMRISPGSPVTGTPARGDAW